jgi:Protein of unknown function (DUF998)
MRRSLLLAGAIAGPLYIVVGTIEAIVRDGFDIRVHPLSILANGDGGWIHTSLLVVSGALTVLGALGVRPSVRRAAWIGLVVYGLGLVAAGFMRADPVDGFPIGTPDGPPETVSWHAVGHVVAGAIGFIGLIVACISVARGARGRWGLFSLATGVIYLVTFIGLGAGGGNPVTNLAFTAAVILGWTWITTLMLRTAARTSHTVLEEVLS